MPHTQPRTSPLVYFVCANHSQWSQAAVELFAKMVAAMKLEAFEFSLVCEQRPGVDNWLDSDAVVVNILERPEELTPDEGYAILSPVVLLTQPKYKVVAWQTLQKVMKQIGKLI